MLASHSFQKKTPPCYPLFSCSNFYDLSYHRIYDKRYIVSEKLRIIDEYKELSNISGLRVVRMLGRHKVEFLVNSFFGLISCAALRLAALSDDCFPHLFCKKLDLDVGFFVNKTKGFAIPGTKIILWACSWTSLWLASTWDSWNCR